MSNIHGQFNRPEITFQMMPRLSLLVYGLFLRSGDIKHFQKCLGPYALATLVRLSSGEKAQQKRDVSQVFEKGLNVSFPWSLPHCVG